MIRLHVTAEGQTEKKFVDVLLAPHLAQYGVYADARCVLTSKDRRAAKEYRGGLVSYQKALADIETWMKEDGSTDCRFTTMFDLYALPSDFPDYAGSKQFEPYARVAALEKAFKSAIHDHRFLPYLQIHEFEALLLADPAKLDWEYLEYERAIRNLIDMVNEQNPELIDDGPETAPSKRILREIPEYDKATAGVSVAAYIGLPTLRKNCRHFDEWVTQLESLGKAFE